MKRTAILVAVLAVLLTGVASAQVLSTMYVPNKSFSGNPNIIPMGGAWPSSTNPRGEWTYQCHLKSKAILRAGMIAGIAFLSSKNQTMTAPIARISMSHTTLANPSMTFSANMPCPKTVYSGKLTWKGQSQVWTTIMFSTGFYYDGRRDLTIQMQFKDAYTTGSTGDCDTDSSHAFAPIRTYRHGTGAYTAKTAMNQDKNGLKVALLYAYRCYAPHANAANGRYNSYPMRTNEIRYQMIVPSNHLPNWPVKINDFGFAATISEPKWEAKKFQVRMAHTTLTDFTSHRNFDANLGPAPVVMTSGPMSWWAVKDVFSLFGLKGSFNYNGKSNLLIEIRHQLKDNGVGVNTDTMGSRLYTTGSGAYNSTVGAAYDTLRCPMVLITFDGDHRLIVNDTMAIGKANRIDLEGFQPNQNYQIAASFTPGFLTLGKHTIGLFPDGLFLTSVQMPPRNSIFPHYRGVMNACGTTSTSLHIPQNTALRGLRVYHAAVAFDAKGIAGVTNTGASLIQ